MSTNPPACLLIHGAGGDAWEWTLWREVFAAGGVHADALWLVPGAGGLAATRFDDYLDQVCAALGRLPRPRVAVGASLGGLLAACAAGMADALVLVNPLPPGPWHTQLPARQWPAIVRWGSGARLAGTRRALADADPATVIQAMRGWRDESGEVLRAAHAGIDVAPPQVPVLCIVSRVDEDVPPATTRALAASWQADLLVSEARSHVGPLLGTAAADTARQAYDWIRRRAVPMGPPSP
ncbi:alpha/beta fold hydrolase [Luteimonas sp. 100069]|uniref:alpha/beta fold hydrolase n=1 Tax=Luteimonas sp. 100069 TaxID=2006109 RepID=UPI000F50776F|nr:alpha/beta fold hydrolase [Luteimonas sp. 100069]RPD88171.1 alpha/beta hydrolase [Luteimonas sp. 100069]